MKKREYVFLRITPKARDRLKKLAEDNNRTMIDYFERLMKKQSKKNGK